MTAYQKKVIEKWLSQLKNDEIDPDALGLGTDRLKAIASLSEELSRISNSHEFRK